MSTSAAVTSDTVDGAVRRVVVSVTVQHVFQPQTATVKVRQSHLLSCCLSYSKLSCFVICLVNEQYNNKKLSCRRDRATLRNII